MTDFALPRPRRRAEPGPVRRFFRWLASDLRAALALAVLIGLLIVAATAPWIAPYSPTAQDVNNMLAAPGPALIPLARNLLAATASDRVRLRMA